MFGGLVSQTPIPLTMVIRKLAVTNLPTPRIAASEPRMSSGTEFAIRWPNPACRNGANRMPGRPYGSWAMMPS